MVISFLLFQNRQKKKKNIPAFSGPYLNYTTTVYHLPVMKNEQTNGIQYQNSTSTFIIIYCFFSLFFNVVFICFDIYHPFLSALPKKKLWIELNRKQIMMIHSCDTFTFPIYIYHIYTYEQHGPMNKSSIFFRTKKNTHTHIEKER